MSDFTTPMMKQYAEIKERYPDTFLFFRCGDFYEIFGKDSIEASKILDINLTKRNDIQMCGVPYHAVSVYIGKMIKAGKKIAIVEQMEDPKLAKGIVKRGVQEIITPGTLIEEKLLQNKINNFLLALNIKGMHIEFSYLDFSTGDFEANEIEYTDDLSLLKGELVRVSPREIIIPEDIWINYKNIREIFEEFENILINRYPVWYFESTDNKKNLFNHLGIKDWKEIGITETKTDLTTPGTLLKYLGDNSRTNFDHIKILNYNSGKNTMILDESTIKNLELLKNQQDGTQVNSLLEILDDTMTSMGGRLLKKWIIEPLTGYEDIIQRQNITSFFHSDRNIINKIDVNLKEIMDLERLCARVVLDKATPKDLVSIMNSLVCCDNIFGMIRDVKELADMNKKYKSLNSLAELIGITIKDDPSNFTDEGNIIREGYDKKLDELKKIALESKEIIANIENTEKEKLGTPSLKIKYNKILGYFFEISKLQSKNVPDTYILRQSLVNVHRYTNRELSEMESKILTARDEINRMEEEIFFEVRKETLEKISEIQCNARLIAELDVYISFAKKALLNHYIKPEINCSNFIRIIEGRHPVVEKKLDVDEFIPNDLLLDTEKDFLYIPTCPVNPHFSGRMHLLSCLPRLAVLYLLQKQS